MFTYSAICDVPEETLHHVTALLHAHRCEIGTRAGRRAGTVRTRPSWSWAGPRRRPGQAARLRRRTADLHLLPLPARGNRRDCRTGARPARRARPGQEGRLVACDLGRDAHRDRPGKRAQRQRPSPLVLRQAQGPGRQRSNPRRARWVPGVVQPGRTWRIQDITAARAHCLGALYKAAADGLPTRRPRDTKAPASACIPRSKAATSTSTTAATTRC